MGVESALNVLGSGNRFQVLGVHASAVAAKVVKLQPVGDLAVGPLPHDNVRDPPVERSVALGLHADFPDPAAGLAVNDVAAQRESSWAVMMALPERPRLAFDDATPVLVSRSNGGWQAAAATAYAYGRAREWFESSLWPLATVSCRHGRCTRSGVRLQCIGTSIPVPRPGALRRAAGAFICRIATDAPKQQGTPVAVYGAAMLPWAGYVRVSSVGGRSGDSFRSPTDQAASITSWAAARGEEVVLLDPELDESGGRQDRPILMQAVEGIEVGQYRGLVVAYLSRAGRSVKHLLEMWDRIEAVGGEVVAIQENIDTSTPAGRLSRTMIAAIEEHALDLYRERFEAQCRSATERGIWQRRQTPKGYTRDTDTRRLIPDGDADLVRQAFQARAAGRAMVDISDMLGMTPSGARGLLANRVYLGELRVRSYVNLTAHPALIDEDLFDRVWLAKASRRPRSRQDVALLAGLVRCAGCGHIMSRATTKVPVYACAGRHSAGACQAPASITLRLLDDHVAAIALHHLEALSLTATSNDTALDEARAGLRAAKKERAAYLEAVQAAGLDTGVYVDGLTLRQDAVVQAEGVVTRALAERPVALAGDVRELWETFTSHERNQLLRGLLEGVLVRRAGGRGSRVPVWERVTVVAAGAGLLPGPYRGGGGALPIVEVVLPDGGGPYVLRLPGGHDGLEGAGG
jgi:DNA invertase Pin-like site-specific DNA recombinase